jgi:hypothetical protein
MEIKKDHYEVACACDAVPLFTANYALMLESLHSLDKGSNLAVMCASASTLIEHIGEADETEIVIIAGLLASSALLHIEHSDYAVCDALKQAIESARSCIPVTGDDIEEQS